MNALLSILKTAGGSLLTSWLAGRERKEKVAAAVAQNKIRLALDEQSNNAAWELAAIEGKDRWLRRISYLIVTGPIVWAFFDPDNVEKAFMGALAVLPDWWLASWVAIHGAIWGVSELKKWKQ